jgi:hypothetical protein
MVPDPMGQVNERFPITPWPGKLAPVPVQRWAVVVGENGGLDWAAQLEPEELPEEWVLRQLADADLEDDTAVAALLRQYGTVPWPFYDPATVPARRRLAEPPRQQRDGWWERRSDGTLEDARWWLKTARALAGTWREASLGGDPASAWAAEGFPIQAGSDCWPQFTVALNVGLRAFRARVEYPAPLPRGGELTLGIPQVGLYSAACLQVFNLLTGPPARRCESATCGRIFVHQVGGAQYRQHRSGGLRFCSPSCAKNETQRTYRRRKAAGKEQQQ